MSYGLSLDVALGLASVIGLAAYLVYVLIHPERF
ncbi:MAG: K(+)-transporting ATPase subunit F [Alphaproteobacteria bacterium]|nr:K(+)-transporting ATPase subunit F [Alphaproteobacteria bacterium]